MIDWRYMIEDWVELIETAGDRLSEQALSYQRAGRYGEAAGAFAAVAEREADAERKWFALWQHARCLRELGDGEGFVRMALRALREHSRRAEPLHDLAQYYQSIQNGALAALFARAALAIPVPEGDLLPVELELYKFGLRNSFSAIARSSSDDEVKECGRAICEWLVLNRDTPAHLRALAGCTLGGYAGDAQLLMPSLRFTPLSVECPEGFHPCNTGISRDGNGLIAMVRAVNWLLRDGRYVLMAGHDTYRSHLVHVALDNELRPVTCKLVDPPTDLPAPRYPVDLGFRDPRPFIWQGELWCICAFRELNDAGLAEMVLLRIDQSDPARIAIAEWRVVPSGMPVKWEGNWMPQIVGDELRLVYSVDPTRTLTDTGEVRYDRPTAIHAESFRGGSQAVRFDDGWLMVIHEVELVKDQRQYFHRFIWMDDDNQLRRLSRRFFFREIGYEFVAGMAWHPDDERLAISFSVNDIDQYIAAVDANDIRAVLLDIPGYERASKAALADAKSTLTVVSDLSALSGRFVAVTKGNVKATFFINNENDGIMKHHASGEFYESEELDIICGYYSGKGTFVDIGANVGNHAIYISKAYDKPRITVFEPNPAAIPILRANLVLNGCTTVDTTHLGIGLGAAPGRLRGTTPDSNNLGGTIYTDDQFGDVVSTDGDAVLREETVEFIKLDVEGMETEILRGLRDTIDRCRPTLFVEVFDRHLDAFRAWCTAMSYSICEDYTRYPHICNYLVRPSESVSLPEEVRAGSGKR
jgi:FkbM family methyltransferase